jgi:hypothetical protein
MEAASTLIWSPASNIASSLLSCSDFYLFWCNRLFQSIWIFAAVAVPTSPALAFAPNNDGRTPTFSREVAPILFKHCVNCHRPGEIAAAHSLLSYDAAKPWAEAIKDQVRKREMPPWPADPQRSMKFRNDARLSRQDIDTLVAWVDADAPRGVDADLPSTPIAPLGWLHPQGIAPDAVVTLPEITLAATGEIPYIQQRVKVPFSEDKWIVAMQMRPGNNALVHHMGITEVATADGVTLEQLNEFAKFARQIGIPDGTLADIRPAVTDPVNPDAYDMLGVYTPGTTFEMYRDGSAKLLKGGKNLYINFNIHYTTTGKPEKDRSQLALWFQSQPPKHQLYRAPAAVATIIANGRQLLTDGAGTKAEGTDVAIPPIPPYMENYELTGVTAYTEPVTIYQLQPHAHMRGKDFKYAVVYPDGRETTILTVPKYDFHWQLAYELDTPLELPAGSKLIVTAHYDNSSKNTHLRGLGADDLARNCGPDKAAYFRRQNQSWHEMFSPLIQYSIDNDNRHALPIAEVVGCLEPSPSRTWMLTKASDPIISETQSTSSAALRAAAAVPFGNQAYQLLGTGVFNPQRHGNRKVAVKGVLIRGADGSRLNVTSLEVLAGTCL